MSPLLPRAARSRRIPDAFRRATSDHQIVEDFSPRLMRYRLMESIVPLAAPGAALVSYAHASGLDIDEATLDFLDWTYGQVPRLSAEGLLPGDLPALLDRLAAQAGLALRSAPEEECEVAVLHPEWADVRITADEILARFREIGLVVPQLSVGLLRDISNVPESER